MKARIIKVDVMMDPVFERLVDLAYEDEVLAEKLLRLADQDKFIRAHFVDGKITSHLTDEVMELFYEKMGAGCQRT
jgi:hypothetical protein